MALLGLSAVGPALPPHARTRLLSAIAREPRTPRRNAMPWWTLLPVAISLVLIAARSVPWHQMNPCGNKWQRWLPNQARIELDATAPVKSSRPHCAGAMRVTLVAANTRPLPQGKAIYSSRTGGLVFFASNFAAAPAKKAYELWLLPANGGPPVPAGVFKPDADGSATVLMPPLPTDTAAKAFAITIEPETGSAAPTLPIVLFGG